MAVDRLGTPGFLALQRAGFTIVDSAPATQAAREVKTPDEIALMRRNGALIVDMLERLRGGGRARGPRVRPAGRALATRCCAAAASTSPRTPCAPGPTRTPGEPRPPTGPLRAGRARLRRYRHGGDRRLLLLRLADVPGARALRWARRNGTPTGSRSTGSEAARGARRARHHVRRAGRARPRRCRPRGSPSATNA